MVKQSVELEIINTYMCIIRTTLECPNCKKQISKSNHTKHVKACSGIRIKKIRGIDYDPGRGYKDGSRHAWNKGLTKTTNQIVASHAAALSARYEKGDLKPSGYRGWSREKCSENAKFFETGGYRENAGRSKKFKVLDSFGKKVCLQSTYELMCSEILNTMYIRWIRPTYLRYGEKKYFPDFYLVDYGIYLDPKNPYLMKKDEEKIKLASQENKVKIYMLKKEELNSSFIRNLLADS